MEPTVADLDRHPVDLTDGPDGVEVSEQENLLGATAEFGHQMIAAFGPRQRGDAAADRGQPRRELGAASIYRGLVGRRRLEADEALNRLEQPRLFGAAEVPESYNRIHAVPLDRHRAAAATTATACAAAVPAAGAADHSAVIDDAEPAGAAGDDNRHAAVNTVDDAAESGQPGSRAD